MNYVCISFMILQAWHVLTWSILCSVLVGPTSGPNPLTIVLNEIRLEQFLPYVEMSVNVDGSLFSKNLGGYGLFIVQYHLSNLRRNPNNPAVLELKSVVDLTNMVVPNDQELAVIDLSLQTGMTELLNNLKLKQENWVIHGFFSEALDIKDNNVVGIFLTYSNNKLFKERFLPGSKRFTEDHVVYINQHVIDYMIVQGKDFQGSMNPMIKLLPFIAKEFIKYDNIQSISRCSSFHHRPFDISSYKYSRKTPGEANDCSANTFALGHTVIDLEAETTTSTTTVPISDRVDDNDIDDAFMDFMVNDDTCPDDDDDGFDVEGDSYTEIQLKSAIQRKRKAGYTENDLDIEDGFDELTNYPYQSTWEDFIDSYLSTKLAKETFMKAKRWIELLINENRPFESKVRCKVCFHHGDEFGIVPRRRSSLMLEEGDMKSKISLNNRMIEDHAKLASHRLNMQELEKRKIDALNNINHLEQPHLVVTNRIMRCVYLEVIKGLSFRSHADLVDLQVVNGLAMGHLCRSEVIAKKITISISSYMHQNLIEFLKSESPPLRKVTCP